MNVLLIQTQVSNFISSRYQSVLGVDYISGNALVLSG